jgi:glycosyltransferase involved in cell wall biosynthesis
MSTTPPDNSSKLESAADMLSVSFSGIVVTFNDDRHLAECLAALRFCEELVVVDLGSTDTSAKVAEDFGARVVRHEWTPLPPREFAVAQAKHQWIVFVDPDMIFPTHTVPLIRKEIREDPRLGIIWIPYRNYFLGKEVKYGRWGGNIAFPAVFRKGALGFQSAVHREIQSYAGFFNSIFLRGSEADIIKHYWADSFAHLYQKVRRYIPQEGSARYSDGERFSYLRLLFKIPYAVFSSLFLQSGILDGWRGVYLSFFCGWLIWKDLLSLRDYQRTL